MMGRYLSICVLLLAAFQLTGSGLQAEEAPIVGVVSRAENQAEIVSLTGTAVAASAGSAVRMRDELRTGDLSRLEVTFEDETVLTLGENARILVDRYVFDPDQSFGEAVLQATRGAFRFAAGRLQSLGEPRIVVSTPFADIGVRGTEFWGGPLDGDYGILLLKGAVLVSNQAGSAALSEPSQGTDIPSPLDPPGPASVWPKEKVDRALATVAFP